MPPDAVPSLIEPVRACLLVADDQPINIRVMHQIFSQTARYRLLAATGGVQALALCQRHPQPDLVLLDIVMPDMDGFAVCRALKANPATCDIPVIFVTAHTDAAQETEALQAGAVDFITKPVTPAVVRARVQTQLTLKAQNDLLRRLAVLDGLTGVPNRRHLDSQLANELARAARAQQWVSVIMLDVDFFKRYNDHYGHLAGDDCLRAVARAIQAGLKRPADFVARYGGEEFVCVLPDTPVEDALQLAHALERSVRALGIAHTTSDVAPVVTVSLGVAGLVAQPGGPEPASADLLARADAALYAAKRSGRGQACLAAEP